MTTATTLTTFTTVSGKEFHAVPNHYPGVNKSVMRDDTGRWQLITRHDESAAVVDFFAPGAPVKHFPTFHDAITHIETN